MNLNIKQHHLIIIIFKQKKNLVVNYSIIHENNATVIAIKIILTFPFYQSIRNEYKSNTFQNNQQLKMEPNPIKVAHLLNLLAAADPGK